MQERITTKSKIKLTGLILMILSSIFGFSNSLTAYYQMGYASIPWYLFGAIAFFLPSALMFAEYGATFKEAKGGIFSWLRGAVGEKTAFIGTFIWLSAWVVWLVSSTQYFLVSLSTLIFGHDTTANWSLFGLSSLKTLGLLEVAFICLVTFFAVRGIDKITRVATVGGVLTLSNAALFAILSLTVLVMNHGHLAEPLTASALAHSPNHAFQTPLAVMSFVVYALFAYGGLETSAGVIDSVDKPEKTFPKALLWAMVIMTGLYLLAITLCGVTANWNHLLGKPGVDLANVEYVMVNNLGYTLGKDLGLSTAAATNVGLGLAHFSGLADVCAGLGAAFVMVYSPIKTFVLGCAPELLPAKLRAVNDKGMPSVAMWIQCALVSIIILGISFGGNIATDFYTVLTDMMNVGSSAPYLFLIGAFPFFKAKQGLDRPFVAYKKTWAVWLVTAIVWLIIAAGIVFTCLNSVLKGDPMTAFWTAIGPVFFGVVAWIFYTVKEKRTAVDKASRPEEE